MKERVNIWMFHYVRPIISCESSYPYLPHLNSFNLDHFVEFLDKFQDNILKPNEYFFSIKNILSNQCRGHLLTFDDGLIDHYKWVFPELKKRGLSGIFFVSTQMYEKDALLHVHKLHCLSGSVGYPSLKREFLKEFGEDHSGVLSNIKSRSAYPYDDPETAGFKYALNHLIPFSEVEEILDRIIIRVFGQPLKARDFYLTKEQAREMVEAGMYLGYHGHSHRPFAQLNTSELLTEMVASEQILTGLVGAPISCVSYPYGDASSINESSILALQSRGVRYGFMAEPSETSTDLMRIPRLDCKELNEFL